MEATKKPIQKTAVPHLHRLQEFETVLKDYHLSGQAQQTLHETQFAVLIGPSSSGRNTIINKLLATGRYHFIISDTTRPPRINNGVLETNGTEYWFRSEEDMLADLRAGKFLEAEVIHRQQVSGISIRELEAAHKAHQIAITDIDIGGVHNVVRLKPDTAVILVLPPSFEEWRHRIQNRGHMTDEEWHRRVETALRIFAAPAEHGFFKIVINDNLEEAVKEVDHIARTCQVDPERQLQGEHLAAELFKAAKSLV